MIWQNCLHPKDSELKPIYISIIKVCFMLTVVVSLYLFARATDFSKTKESISTIGFGFPMLLLITAVAYTFGTLGWKYCITTGAKNIPLWRLFMIRHVCETVSLFNPASIVGGDLLKIQLLKPYQLPGDVIVNSVVISRALMVISQLLLLLTAMIWLVVSSSGIMIPMKYVAVLFLVIIVLFWTAYYLSKRLRISRITNIFLAIRGFYKNYRKAFLLSFSFFTLHWIAGSLEFFAIIRLLGIKISVIQGLLLDMGVIVVKSFGAFIPGQLGIEEIGNKLMLALLGIGGSSIWLSVSILRRARQLVWLLIGGFFYLILHSLKPKNGDIICKS